MRFVYPFFFPLCLFVLSAGCKKEQHHIKETVVDNYIYNINPVVVYESNVQKTRQKTPELFIATLYANLFQTTISANELALLAQIELANGDKQMIDELILNDLMNSVGVVIPSNQQMRNDIEKFIFDTYLRFYLRQPTPYEALELKREIEQDNGLTPTLIYQSFALSNEYKFY